MGWQTALPDAILALVAAAQNAPELEGVTVHDGPALESDADVLVLYIGWTGGTGDIDADAQVGAEGLAGNPDREQSLIRCTAHAIDGGADIPTARAAAYGIVSGLGAVIAADRTLGKTVMRAAIGSHQLTQQQTGKGAEVAIGFEVTTDTFTRR